MSIGVHLVCSSPRTIALTAALVTASLSGGCAAESVAMHRLPVISLDDAGPVAPTVSEDSEGASSEWTDWTDCGSTSVELSAFPASGSTVPPTTLQDEWGRRHGTGRADPRHMTLLFGLREMEKDTWDPIEDHTVGGIEVDVCDPSTGHGYEIGVAYSTDDDDIDLGGVDVDVEGETIELYGGYRHTFRAAEDGHHPYVGLGLAVINAELEASALGASGSDDDTSPGAYVRMGIGWDVGRMRVGVDYRHLFGTDIDIEDVDGNANFDQLALTLGWAF